MKIYMVSAEVEPFAKTGGLGDVLGALPKALSESGADVRVVCPLYKIIPAVYKSKMRKVGAMTVTLNWRRQHCEIKECKIDKVTFYFIESQYYFNGNSIYDAYDLERFAFFCKAALELLTLVDFKPDVIHAHDWSSALIPVYLDHFYSKMGFYNGIKKVFTIHNLNYQGKYNVTQAMDATGLPDSYFTYDRLEFYGLTNLLKGGIVYSDLVTTVSPTYAKEIQTPEIGCGLNELLAYYSYKLHGILNGVDYEVYGPLNDGKIFKSYDAKTVKEGKAVNKKALQEQLKLDVDPNIPLIGIVSRLVNQKGLDIVIPALPALAEKPLQLVVLGTGAYNYEEGLVSFAGPRSNKISAIISFSDELSRQIYAASDFFLMPSMYEPCGLSQIIAMKYGALPIVRETGGLKDTITPYNEYTGQGNGFSFAPYNMHDMLFTIDLALDYYFNRKDHFTVIQSNALNSNFSWEESSKKYLELYESIKKQ